MAVPSSGELKEYADIGVELGVAQSNVSLRGMSAIAGFSVPDAMSEFYGYSSCSCSSVLNTVDVFGDGNGLALWQFNNNVSDLSGNYSFSSANVGYTTGKFSQAATLGQYVSATGSGLTTGLPLTISFWIKPSSIGYAVGLYINKRSAAANGFSIGNYPGVLGLLNGGGYLGDTIGIARGLKTDSEWYHVAVAITTGGFVAYVNGGESGREVGGVINSSHEISLGYKGIGNWNGSASPIDQMRVFNRILNASEIKSLYEEQVCNCPSILDNYDPFGDNSGKALWQFNGNANDLSGNYNGTATGVTYITEGAYGQAARFLQNTHTYVQTSYNLSSGQPWSMSIWTRWRGQDDAQYPADYILQIGSSQLNSFYWYVGLNGEFVMNVANGSYGSNFIAPDKSMLLDTWQHWVITHDGTANANSFKVYNNGVLFGSTTLGRSTPTTSGGLLLGASGKTDPSDTFNGDLDQVRMFNRVVTPEEAKGLFKEQQP